jgi:hypothetical protein
MDAALPLLPAASTFFEEVFPVASAFEERIVQTGVGTVQMTLIAFLTTFLITRLITHMIKAGRGPFGNISVGGTHLHHLVPGIFLLLISGVLGIAMDIQAEGVAGLIIPTLFGIGAALTLDEFALWLTLKDVYWSHEGRRSIDAVIVLASLLTLLALGLPFWADVARDANVTGSWLIFAWHVLSAIFAVICFLKVKWIFAALGVLIWPFALVGAFRLARPTSLWARKFYGVAMETRAQARYPEDRRMPMWPWQTPKDTTGDAA